MGGEEVGGGVRGGPIDAEDGGTVGGEEEAAKWSYRGEGELTGNASHRYSIGVTIEQRTWSHTRELEDSQPFEGWIRRHFVNYL